MAKDFKVKANMKNLDKLLKAMSQSHILRIGILGSEATSQAAQDGLTNAQLGAVHELGAHINHPGGTPYIINEDGSARFVPKDSILAQGAPKTKPHHIDIPARSFLAMPLEKKLNFKGNQLKLIKRKLFQQVIQNKEPIKFLQDLGAYALAVIDEAFASGGFGEWAPLTAGTTRQKAKKGQSNQILRATGQLARTISFKVIKKNEA